MDPKISEPILVLMTTAKREEANQIASMLVEGGLAACVQILPGIESIYRWQGKTQRESEVLILAKTMQDKFAELVSRVTAIHSYETPEIVGLPITAAAAPYLKWVAGSLCDGS